LILAAGVEHSTENTPRNSTTTSPETSPKDAASGALLRVARDFATAQGLPSTSSSPAVYQPRKSLRVTTLQLRSHIENRKQSLDMPRTLSQRLEKLRKKTHTTSSMIKQPTTSKLRGAGRIEVEKDVRTLSQKLACLKEDLVGALPSQISSRPEHQSLEHTKKEVDTTRKRHGEQEHTNGKHCEERRATIPIRERLSEGVSRHLKTEGPPPPTSLIPASSLQTYPSQNYHDSRMDLKSHRRKSKADSQLVEQRLNTQGHRLLLHGVGTTDENNLGFTPLTALYPDSRFVVGWTSWIILLTIYTAFLAPLRLGFTFPTTDAYHLNLVEVIVEVCFLVDVLVGAMTGYVDTDTGDAVMAPLSKVATHYAKGWLVPDLLGSIPDQIITMSLGLDSPDSTTSDSSTPLSALQTTRVMKLFKLLKLLRLIKLWKAVSAEGISLWQNPALITMTKLGVTFLFVLHVTACGFWSVVSTAKGKHHASVLFRSALVDVSQVEAQSIGDQYLAAFYWSTLMMLGNDAQPNNSTERAFATGVLLCDIVAMAFLVGGAASLAASGDASAEVRQKQLHSIRRYLRYRKVSRELQLRIYGYYTYLWNSSQSMHQGLFLDQLPASLGLELGICLKRRLVERCRLFQNVSPQALVALIRCLSPIITVPQELVVKQGDDGDCMFFISKGAVIVSAFFEHDNETGDKQLKTADAKVRAKFEEDGAAGAIRLEETALEAARAITQGGDPSQTNAEEGIEFVTNTLTEGAHFGEIALVRSDAKRTATVKSAGYCELEVLYRSDFNNLADTFKGFQDNVLYAVLRREKRHTSIARRQTMS